MAREKEFYRENLELLNARYPDHDMLSFDEVKTVMGWTDNDAQVSIQRERLNMGTPERVMQ